MGQALTRGYGRGEQTARDAVAAACRHLSDRGLSPGSSGNVSMRLADTMLVTPTGLGLHRLGPDDIARVPLDDHGDDTTSGPRPSKEVPLHRAVYLVRDDVAAVVHLHAPFSVALSCRPLSTWPRGRLPWLTPYQVMKVGEVAMVPYAQPGSTSLAAGVTEAARDHRCALLANHGSLACGSSLSGAVEAAEEVEATARLLFTVEQTPFTELSPDQVQDLRRGGPARC